MNRCEKQRAPVVCLAKHKRIFFRRRFWGIILFPFFVYKGENPLFRRCGSARGARRPGPRAEERKKYSSFLI